MRSRRAQDQLKYDNAEEAESLKKEIQAMIKKNWPKSFLKVNVDRQLDGNSPTIWIKFALGKKESWLNGIIHNDPAFHIISVRNNKDGGWAVSSSDAGSIHLSKSWKRVKTGWRNAKGDRKKVLRTLTSFYGTKLKKVIEDNKDEIKMATKKTSAAQKRRASKLRADKVRAFKPSNAFERELHKMAVAGDIPSRMFLRLAKKTEAFPSIKKMSHRNQRKLARATVAKSNEGRDNQIKILLNSTDRANKLLSQVASSAKKYQSDGAKYQPQLDIAMKDAKMLEALGRKMQKIIDWLDMESHA